MQTDLEKYVDIMFANEASRIKEIDLILEKSNIPVDDKESLLLEKQTLERKVLAKFVYGNKP